MWQEKLYSLAKNHAFQLSMTAVLTTTAGVIAGAKLTEKKADAKYKAIADAEILDVKNHYAVIRKEGENGDLASMAQRYANVIDREQYGSIGDDPESDEAVVDIEKASADEDEEDSETPEGVVIRNIFDNREEDTDFDYDTEIVWREEHPDEPYVISKDEFDQNDNGWEQVNLTYFEGDEALADERDQLIPDVDRTTGITNLQRFGHGSKDPNVVYIRNERLNIDIEVNKSDGSFAEEVLGFIQHSDNRRPRRFRHDD